MGGKEGIRGYLYQTIISVLHTLIDSEWMYLQIEPDTDNSKIDVMFENRSGEIRAQQIKSSINNFGKSDIITWLEEIIKDQPSSSKYELILFGNVSSGTKNFINQFPSGIDITESILINRNISKISVEVFPFKQELMERNIQSELHRFLEAENIILPHSSLVLISGGLIYQFLQFSTVGKKVSREEFAQHLITWTKQNYSKELSKIKRSKLDISFYGKTDKSFTKSIIAEENKFFEPYFLNEHSSVTYESYKAALAIKLPARDKKGDVQQSLSSSLNFSSLFNEGSDADVSEWQKSFIVEKMKGYYNINIEKDFFNVGNLKNGKFDVTSFLMYRPNNFIGTDLERKKNEAIDTLYFNLKLYESLKDFLDFLKTPFVLTMALGNFGETYDEEIVVDLKVPKDVVIFTAANIKLPDNYRALSILIKSKFLRTLLEIKSDSIISEYERYYMNSEPFETLDSLYQIGSGTNRLNNRRDQIIRDMEYLFDHEIFTDAPLHNLIKYEFKQLNPNTYIGFPSKVLFYTTNSFNIEYSIKSKLSSAIHSGSLQVNLDHDVIDKIKL